MILVLLAAPALSASDPPDGAPASSVPPSRITILDLGLDTRFNYMDRQDGEVTDRGGQYRIRSRVRVDLLKNGSSYLEIRSETGKGFDNSWNNSGAGLGGGQSIFNVKSIALHQKIGSRLEAQAGGLEFDRGAGTDATYASGDGHMTGYRAVLDGQGIGLVEKISVTAGYLGDFEKPNFFSRVRMDRVNYVQVLAEQPFGESWRGAAEFDRIHGVAFARGAVHRERFWKFSDATVETAARSSSGFRFAWSSSVSRKWTTNGRWRSDLIYSDLPDAFYVVNGRRMLMNRGELDVGKRISTGAVYRLSRNCEAGVFGGRLLDSTPSKRWVAQVGISYQFAGLVNRLLR